MGLLLAVALTHVSWADELALTGDARLSGEVRSIREDGVVHVASELSPEPLMLKSGAVKKITFAAHKETAVPPGGLVELVNGDVLPASIEDLDATRLKIATPDIGSLEIARDSLKSIQLGVHDQKLLYSGPNSLEEWTKQPNGVRSWRFRKNTLLADGPAVAMREIDVPERFVLRFNLKWKNNPSFTVYFADPLVEDGGKVDRYFMQFSPSGMEVKRESSRGQVQQSVILLNRGPEEFPTNQVNVELRVDRKSSKIHLFLDGEQEASGIDPVDEPPTGSGIAFVSSVPSGTTMEVGDIQVLDFDDARERHHAEDRGDPKTDSMISHDEDRWGGQLTSIRQHQDGTLLTFVSDFQDQPLELLERDVSTVFFAQPEKAAEGEGEAAWIVRLQGGGALRVASCAIADESILASHPMLGPLKIRRAGVVSLERIPTQEPAEKEGKP